MLQYKNSKNFTANTQMKMSPFFERTSKLNMSQEWKRWGGYLSATKYDLNHDNEYFAIRTNKKHNKDPKLLPRMTRIRE